MVEPASAFQDWLLQRASDGTTATLPGNLLRGFEADDTSLVPVFVAHAWQDHLHEAVSGGRRRAAEAEQLRLEEAFHGRLGLEADADGDLALELGRAVDRSLDACRCCLHLTAQPMPDGRQWFRLEIRESVGGPAVPGGEAAWLQDTGRPETVKLITVDSRSQAQAIACAVHGVLKARGFQAASAEQGLFHLEGPQLGALVGILQQLALPETQAAPAPPLAV